MEDRVTQRHPDPLGGGLLGEEQFDVALLLNHLHQLKNEERPPSRLEDADLTLIRLHCPSFDIKRAIIGVEVIAHFHHFIFDDLEPRSEVVLKDAWKLALHNTWLQAKHYTQSCQSRLQGIVGNFLDQIKLLRNPCKQSCLRRISSIIPLFLSRIAEADYAFMCKIEAGQYVNPPTGTTPVLYVGDNTHYCKIIFGRKLVVLCLECDYYLLSHDQWLMIHNKSVEIWLVLIYAFLGEGVQFSDGFHNRVYKAIKFLRKLVERYGNDAYKFCKNLEGLLTGIVIAREEKWSNTQLLDVMWDAILSDRLGFPSNYHDSTFFQLLESCTTPELIELCGISKLNGHPDIQSISGLEKLKQRTQKYIPVTYESILEVIHMIKKDFCECFLKRHYKWPLVYLKPGCPEIITQAVLRNKWIEDPELTRKYGRSLSLYDWDFIELGQIMEFDWVEAHLPFLKDRALAPRLSQLVREDADRIRIPIEDRRVLLKFLLTQKIFRMTSRYMERYGEDPKSVIDYLVIKLTQKEGELKVDGRMFGQSPYEERFKRCVMEHNVSRLMIDYDPYQSMTTSEMQKVLKLIKFRTLSKEVTNARVIQFSIDAEAWNNYFRPELVNAVGAEFFDRVLGVDLYRFTMATYQHSYFYANVDQQRVAWYGQQGGIEGLSQKVWTWIYSRVALRVLDGLGYKGYIMVCGDDLRIAVIFPNEIFIERTETEVAATFKGQLQLAFDRYGFKMKVSETVASETFIAYGKVYQVGDSFMSGGIKKVAKIHGFQGTTFPLIEQQVASIYSNAHATCQVTTTHVAVHIMAGFVTILRLQGKRQSGFSNVQLTEMLCRPSVLGGLPVLHLSHFMIRGESDHLTIAISFAIYLISSDIDPPLGWSLLCTPLSRAHKRDFRQLLTDPYCLPIDKPDSATAFIKRRMESHIRLITKNSAMRQVFRIYSRRNQTLFINALRSMNVYLVKVLAVLWECSPFNIINEIIQKFESSRSVFQLLCLQRRRRSLYSFLERARQKERQMLTWLAKLASRTAEELKDFHGITLREFSQLVSITHPTLKYCPTQYTQEVRDFAWGKPVLTVTYPCISDFFKVYMSVDNIPPYVRSDHILSKLYLQPEVNHHYASGNNSPWVGTVTSEKLILPQVSLDFEGSISAKVSKILKLIEFTRCNGPEILRVIEWVLEKVSGHTLAHFYAMIPKRTSGTISHRLRSRAFNETVMINEVPNRTQLISIHHDTHVSVQEKPGDYSINYMALVIHHMTTILFPLECSSSIPLAKYDKTFYSQVNTACQYCFYDVADVHVVEMDLDLPDLTCLPGSNPLVGFTESLEEEISRRIAELGLQPRYETFQHEQQEAQANDVVANHVVAAALIKETFGGSQEAYELGIQVKYESHRMKMDALYNRPPRVQLSIRDWKAVEAEALVDALIRECFHWILKTPLMKTKRLDDVINLPPQLNPFTIIAQKLILAKRVQELHAAFVSLQYPVRPLGALDLSNNTCCSKWLLTTIYPIIEAVFHNRAPKERILTFYSYESDDTLIPRIERALDLACLHLYQNFLRIFYITQILGYPVEDAIPYTFGPYRITKEINYKVNAHYITDRELAEAIYSCITYLQQTINQFGVYFPCKIIKFGETTLYPYGCLETESIDTFIEHHFDEFLTWPYKVRDYFEPEVVPDLDPYLLDEIFAFIDPPGITIYRYGLYSCINICRTILDERFESEGYRSSKRSNFCQLIQIGERTNRIQDIRDLTSDPIGTGSLTIAEQICHLIDEYDPDMNYPIPFTHLSRINGHTITSVVKLHEIFVREDILEKFERPKGTFWGLCLADGAGGFTNYLLGLSPHIRIIFNTLYQPDPDEIVSISTPGEVLLSGDVRIINRCYSHHNYTSCNDLTEVATVQHLDVMINEYTESTGVSIITFDAEGKNLDKNETYFSLILNVCVIVLRSLTSTGLAIIKTFLSKNRDIWALLNTFCDSFSYVKIVKPLTSHSINSEFYLLVANPVFNIETRRVIAQEIMQGKYHGPANFEFLQEMTLIIDTIRSRRHSVISQTETPYAPLTWAVINWKNPLLPPFTWGIIFRRLSITAPAHIVDPSTHALIWTDSTRDEIIMICNRTLEESRATLLSLKSSVLDYTTHTHLCQRFQLYVRILAFRHMLIYAPNNIANIISLGIQAIEQRILSDSLQICAQFAITYDEESTTINKDMGNLQVNIIRTARDGISLGLRYRAAEHAHLYYKIHEFPPTPPNFPDYDPLKVRDIPDVY